MLLAAPGGGDACAAGRPAADDAQRVRPPARAKSGNFIRARRGVVENDEPTLRRGASARAHGDGCRVRCSRRDFEVQRVKRRENSVAERITHIRGVGRAT